MRTGPVQTRTLKWRVKLIQKELDDGFIEELPDIVTAEQRWPKGIALGKLGVVHADGRESRLVLDSTICGMNGRCHLPANYSIAPTEWESFLNLLNDCATITTHNHLHLPIGSRVVEFKHNSISSNSQLPRDVPIERHVWIRLRDPNCDKRRLPDASKETLLWSEESLLPLLKSIPLNRSTQMTITAAADAFATDEMGIGGWIKSEDKTFLVQPPLEQTRTTTFPWHPEKSSKIHVFMGSLGSTLHPPLGQPEVYHQTWHY